MSQVCLSPKQYWFIMPISYFPHTPFLVLGAGTLKQDHSFLNLNAYMCLEMFLVVLLVLFQFIKIKVNFNSLQKVQAVLLGVSHKWTKYFFLQVLDRCSSKTDPCKVPLTMYSHFGDEPLRTVLWLWPYTFFHILLCFISGSTLLAVG